MRKYPSKEHRKQSMTSGITFALVLGLLIGTVPPPVAPAPPIDFNHDIRPILSNHCLKCHGPDEKQRAAGLRLDTYDGAVKLLASGKRAVSVKTFKQSELLNRIHSTGPLQMPPATANKPLNQKQKQLLERWISSGAKYTQHWAFVPPKRSLLNQPDGNPIDVIARRQQSRMGLPHAPQASKLDLLRRLSLDLTGLPPTSTTIASFLADNKPGAYERQVDAFLASPHYGERWARKWMDLARYADTNGYEKDRPRTIWPWRDYVINAFNTDKSFQAFTIEQLAGDMLPNATDEQRIATGFHRNTMLNEEGGIDPNEYRFLSVVDRLATTGTTWLGLTIACAQCHTHKFDPITHTDYYRMFAYLNNADEPDIPVYTAKQKQDIAASQHQAKAIRAKLLSHWTPVQPMVTGQADVLSASAINAAMSIASDGVIKAGGPSPLTDTYTVSLKVPTSTNGLRLTALADADSGPGRTSHGNFVVTGVDVDVNGTKVGIRTATATAQQDGFPASAAIDSDTKSGWAIHDPKRDWRHDQSLDLSFKQSINPGSIVRVTIRQDFGGNHTLARFKVVPLVKQHIPQSNADPEAVLAKWTTDQRKVILPYTKMLPDSALTNLPTLKHVGDGIILAGGDQSKSDTYTLTYNVEGKSIGALRLETLADNRFPQGGPGRTAYEGPLGDFALTELTVEIDGKPVQFAKQAHAVPGGTAPLNAIDGDLLTSWSPGGNIGRNNTAWLPLQNKISGKKLTIRMLCEKYYAAGIGKFRWSSSTETALPSSMLEADVQDAIAVGETNDAVRYAFASTRPELADAVSEISLLEKAPQAPMSLVMQERQPSDARTTTLHHRGEFLQPREKVSPALPTILLTSYSSARPKNRLEFAQWLVSSSNPLTARVYVNRQWQAFFGRGIVKTLDDFGTQGDLPTNQELLDYLALRFMDDGWSTKKLHRLIVTSDIYKQAATVPSKLRAADPENIHLTRGPRVRLDAEQIRDSVLSASGQLSRKLGGPSVFPPQPAGVTTEGSYGALQWNVSTGEDRYRRGLYTFAKRTAPFAMATTFDAPSGEACVARRESSTTPLQALTLLNDITILEAARSLGNQLAALPPSKRIESMFMRTLCRPAKQSEAIAISLIEEESIAAGVSPSATWAMLARALMNTDEMVTKP